MFRRKKSRSNLLVHTYTLLLGSGRAAEHIPIQLYLPRACHSQTLEPSPIRFHASPPHAPASWQLSHEPSLSLCTLTRHGCTCAPVAASRLVSWPLRCRGLPRRCSPASFASRLSSSRLAHQPPSRRFTSQLDDPFTSLGRGATSQHPFRPCVARQSGVRCSRELKAGAASTAHGVALAASRASRTAELEQVHARGRGRQPPLLVGGAVYAKGRLQV